MKVFLIILGILVVLVGVTLWYYNRVIWRCKKCGLTFRIPFRNFITGLNVGIHDKVLYCPYCKRKTRCQGEIVHDQYPEE